MDNETPVLDDSSTDRPPPANRILGYTRWNEDIIQVEQSEEIDTEISTTIETTSTFPTTNPPAKIKMSLSQTQIACKPPTKPSAIPKRTIPLRPSAVLNQSMSLQKKLTTSKLSTSDSDSYNEVFAESKPEPKKSSPSVLSKPNTSNLSTDCRIPVTEKRTLLRKFSAPIIEVTPVGQPNGSPRLGARLAAHHETTTSSMGNLNTGGKSKLSTNNTNNTNQYMDDKHKCTVCSNPFSDPRVLDCLHTFCFACLCNMNPAGGGLGVVGETHAEGAAFVDVNGDGVGRRRLAGDGSDMDLSGE